MGGCGWCGVREGGGGGLGGGGGGVGGEGGGGGGGGVGGEGRRDGGKEVMPSEHLTRGLQRDSSPATHGTDGTVVFERV